MSSTDWTKPSAYPDDRPAIEKMEDVLREGVPGSYRIGEWTIDIDPVAFVPRPPKEALE